MTIFDWDDTLFPTSVYSPKSEEEMFEILVHNEQTFKDLDKVVSSLLKLTMSDSKVLIITNAHSSWVTCSSQVFLPLTHKVI